MPCWREHSREGESLESGVDVYFILCLHVCVWFMSVRLILCSRVHRCCPSPFPSLASLGRGVRSHLTFASFVSFIFRSAIHPSCRVGKTDYENDFTNTLILSPRLIFQVPSSGGHFFILISSWLRIQHLRSVNPSCSIGDQTNMKLY